ncbi:MAG: ABC transporter ATP-binding protein [Spirochaetia bacterium]|jgi:ABC-type multidrug transport system fused ATPase/permease subunit|nr:ABC transporter ATP-binding protein [Spirochaetia bacterium]
MKTRLYKSGRINQKSDKSTWEGIVTLWKILNKRERKGMIILLCLILILSFIEMLGISSIMPFLAVAAKPELVNTNHYLNTAYRYLGYSRVESFLVLLGVVVAGFILLRSGFNILVRYAKSRFSNMLGHHLASRLLANYLSRPYVFFLNENSSNLAKNVLGEVSQVLSGYINPLFNTATDFIVGISICLVIILVDPLAAVIVTLSIGVIYGGIYLLVRKLLVSLGGKRLNANRERYKSTMEVMAGIKDVKLLGKERYFLEKFIKPSRKMAKANIKIAVIGKVPNYILNAVIDGGIVIIITILLAFTDDFASFIPVVGVYVLAGNRIMPRFKDLFDSFSSMRAHQMVVEMMLEHLSHIPEVPLPDKSSIIIPALPFEKEIKLKNITFTYPNTEEPVIHDQSFIIPKNTTVGLVGPTGCGKTTLVDIILGLLGPEKGEIIVDGIKVDDNNIRNWQMNLGYVPQTIYLSDDTITANIAFGVDEKNIDHDAVRHAARVANLADFIENELPDGYNTTTGERGVRLSGGQKQRLGIARALYTDPSVLVMDEATSALDGITESVVMEAIEKLTGSKTIIIIAHRLTTLIKADVIYMMEKGRVKAHGSYRQLMEQNKHFQKMSRVER